MPTNGNTTWADSVTRAYWISQRFVPDAQRYQVEAWVKVPRARGIRHLLWWAEAYDEEQMLREALAQGTFSSRPFRLGHGADSTAGACVDALYVHFCAAQGLDPETLYYLAYQRRSEQGSDPQLTRHLAEWQGLVYPKQWGEQEALRLLRELAAINSHGLVTAILDTLPHLAERFYPVRRSSREGRAPTLRERVILHTGRVL